MPNVNDGQVNDCCGWALLFLRRLFPRSTGSVAEAALDHVRPVQRFVVVQTIRTPHGAIKLGSGLAIA